MRVVLATVGTRGDVQPMLALAQSLARGGHTAVVACPESFAEWVRAHGVEHAALGEDLQALLAERGSKLEQSLAGMTRYFTEQMALQGPRLVELATGADAIVGTGMAWTVPSVGEKLGIPALVLVPSTSALSSRLHPPPLLPWYGLPRWVNALLWWLSDLAQNRLMGAPLNGARARLGLAPVGAFSQHLFGDTPVVVAADEALLPPDPAWQGRYSYTGFLFLDDPAPLGATLDAWLASGEPPIYVGFGSMAGEGPERVGTLLVDAIRASGRRCLVSAGSAGLFGTGALPEGFFLVREAPHRALFPRVAVVVHHGGAGTTAAAARAGVPQVVLPMMLDQFHHAHHVARAGLGPRAPTMKKVTGRTLALAIEHALALPDAPRHAMAKRLEKSDAGATIVERLERLAHTRDLSAPRSAAEPSASSPT